MVAEATTAFRLIASVGAAPICATIDLESYDDRH